MPDAAHAFPSPSRLHAQPQRTTRNPFISFHISLVEMCIFLLPFCSRPEYQKIIIHIKLFNIKLLRSAWPHNCVHACENTVRRLCRHTRRAGTDCPDRADLPPSLADTRLDAEGHMAAPGFVNAHIHPAQTFVGGPWVDYDYAIRSRGVRRRKPNTSPTRPHEQLEELLRAVREAIRRGTTHVRGHIDVGVFGLAELEDAARARGSLPGRAVTSSMSPCPQTAS